MSERSGPGGPAMLSASSSDPSGTVLSYPPKFLIFSWAWGDPDEVAALSVATTVFFITIVFGQVRGGPRGS